MNFSMGAERCEYVATEVSSGSKGFLGLLWVISVSSELRAAAVLVR